MEKRHEVELKRKLMGGNKRRWEERGMRMGVGKFNNGVLQLRPNEIKAMNSDKPGNKKARRQGNKRK
jgi:hypothetical protein